ncbi:MAG: ATP-grasp fold amidoligase family protein [Methanobacteriaceae archaeon]|nr:ATP-grasp fold amidoligase family protein [Methanobacteriaceae archaeon]
METFLSLIRRRFEGKDDTVPWELDDKFKAYNLAERQNVNHPKIIAVLEDINDLKKIDLPNKFVIKISPAHSTIGVMLLTRMSSKKYFDHISLNQYDLDSIIDTQKRIAEKRCVKLDSKSNIYWLIEELLDNILPTRLIPFDYKFYCFHGHPKIIIQTDRNTNPSHTVIFDGTFIPLIYGKDYHLDHARLLPGIPFIPLHLISMLKIASKLSKAVNDKFVRIDLYDTPKGVYFGEFTFAPGGPDTGMIKFSEEILAHLDSCLNNKKEVYKNLNNNYFSINHKKFSTALEKIIINPDFDNIYHLNLLIRAYNKDYRAIRRIARFFSQEKENIENKDIKLLYEHLALCWEMISFYLGDNELIYNLLHDIQNKNGFINKRYNIKKLIQKGKNYLKTKGDNSWWYKIRYAQFILEFSQDKKEKDEAMDIINYYVSQDQQFAKEVLMKYSLKGRFKEKIKKYVF